MQKCESLHRPLKRQIYSSAYCAGGSQHFISQSCWGLPLHLYCCFNTISGRIAFLLVNYQRIPEDKMGSEF
ncbi:hypothetical protein OUZ56_001654 [Daphnia magna]|uniref:Uncharacterized protein n=1 Tax=Daphnia magna TaxID=35525 RepID=A0ABR0A3B7_9CRUS|nr:hypothetical protein OUZ56_001654 [Daphnia magna]